MAEELKVKFGKASEDEVVKIQPGGIGGIKRRFEKIDQVLSGITFVLVLSVVAIIISVVGLFLDQMRYNNAAYKEYSQKIELVDTNQITTNELLEQNKQNQNLIIEQQKQLSKLLEKK